MELRQVRYFLAVVDAGSFTAAARDLSIVQSAVSQQVARLERELGTTLLDRSRRLPVLTAAGERFVPAARALLSAELAALRAVERGDTPRLRLGVGSDLDRRAGTLGAAWSVQAAVLDAPARQARVADGDLDAALVHGDDVRPDLLALPVESDVLLVVVADTHPLADRDVIALGDLTAHRLVLGSGALGTSMADLVVRSWRAAGGTGDLERTPADSAVLATVRATPRSWTVWFAEQAAALRPEALNLRFLRLDPPLRVPLMIVVRPERADLGRDLTAALSTPSREVEAID